MLGQGLRDVDLETGQESVRSLLFLRRFFHFFVLLLEVVLFLLRHLLLFDSCWRGFDTLAKRIVTVDYDILATCLVVLLRLEDDHLSFKTRIRVHRQEEFVLELLDQDLLHQGEKAALWDVVFFVRVFDDLRILLRRPRRLYRLLIAPLTEPRAVAIATLAIIDIVHGVRRGRLIGVLLAQRRLARLG